MKIARIEYSGGVSYALVVDGGFELIEGDVLGDWSKTGKVVAESEAKLLAPIAEPKQVVCIGLNYKGHATECGMKFPTAPVVFVKTMNVVAGPDNVVRLPKIAPEAVDYEAELVMVMGKDAKNVSEADVDDYVLGYCCGNDISARDCQIKQDVQWARGKCFDGFAPMGPWIATGLDGDNLAIKLTLNGEVMQDSNTSDLIFSCRYLVSYLSRCMTLYAGSVIMTGTPSGVGMGRKPAVYMKAGDVVEVEIEGIGKLRNKMELEA